MSRVGLVLGGGGITGAAFHFGVLLSLELATGWKASRADVIVGSSCGAVVAALARADSVSLQALVGDSGSRGEYAAALARELYPRTRPRGVGRWLRRGVLPGLRRPDVRLLLGSPARCHTAGISQWVRRRLGSLDGDWPVLPTLITALDLESRRRVAFGAADGPSTDLATAVAASSAVPLVYEPVSIEGRWYVDAGMVSGTHADLVLGSEEPLDLILVVAPMASDVARPRARFYERMVDRAGRAALDAELELIGKTWPETEVAVLRPDRAVLDVLRPNPFSTAAAVPSFVRTVRSMRSLLAHPTTWKVLERHLTG